MSSGWRSRVTQDPVRRRGIDVEVMERDYPKAHSYLTRFEGILQSRPAYHRYFTDDDPFWSMFNVSSFTFAPWKVVWREQAALFTAAVIGPKDGRPVVPDHKLMMVEAGSPREARYICAALNSAPATLAVYAYAIEISTNTHVLENVAVPRYSPRDPLHRRLSDLSEAAHTAASEGDAERVSSIEAEIDVSAARLWGLSESELAEIHRSLGEA